MSTVSLLTALKVLSNHFELYDFQDLGKCSLETAIHTIRIALIQSYRKTDSGPYYQRDLGAREDFEFTNLVIVKIESLMSVRGPISTSEQIAASNAISFIARKLAALPAQSELISDFDFGMIIKTSSFAESSL